jgi:hypothetical protein
MPILFGCAMPAHVVSMWDHTYVESDDGLRWGCFGRNTGGSQICSDGGDSAFADCLSKQIYQADPSGTVIPGVSVYSDIVYLITGVRHQAANRILVAAGGLLVVNARGYGWSQLAWGAYGTDPIPWQRLQQCAKLHSVVGGAGSSGGGSSMASDPRSLQLANKIREIYRRFTSMPPSPEQKRTVARDELFALASVNLGENYDRQKMSQIADLQEQLRDKQLLLATELQEGKLKTDDYLSALRSLHIQTATRCREILGQGDFQRLFGVPADAAADFINGLS